jgi:hypothetical protein
MLSSSGKVYNECRVQLEVKEPDYDAYDSKYLGR